MSFGLQRGLGKLPFTMGSNAGHRKEEERISQILPHDRDERQYRNAANYAVPLFTLGRYGS